METSLPQDRIVCVRAMNAAGYALMPLCSASAPHDHIVGGQWKPCKTPGKVPVLMNWRRIPQGKYDESNIEANYGVVLKETDLVIDVDPRRYDPPADNPLARLCEEVGDFLQTFVVGTGGGGYHVYLRIPAGAHIRGTLPGFAGLEFKTAGHQVVGPGCAHASGGRYLVRRGEPARALDAPLALLRKLAGARTAPDGRVKVSEARAQEQFKDDESAKKRFEDFLKRAKPAIEGQGGDGFTFRTAAIGRDYGLSEEATYALMSGEWNARCQPPWDEDELRAKVAHAYRYARGVAGSARPDAHFDTVPQAILLGEFDGKSEVDDEQPVGMVLNARKEPVKCFQNTLNQFYSKASGLVGIFGFNEFARRVEFLSAAPWHVNGDFKRRMPVQDPDLSRMRAHLARRMGWDAQTTDLIDAMVDRAHKRRFHPVREYLDGLKWDGKPRLDFWLRDFCGVEDSAYSRAVARKVLCAAVARVLDPGCKFDYVLVLEGHQGIGKSGICRILGGEWFTDFKMNAGEKDTVQMMQGKWIVEMAELHAARQTDVDTLKAFLTRQVDEARFAYGRLAGEYPRQGIFIATYNPGPDGTYLKDDTGNRRWWPVRCHGVPPGAKHLDFAGLAAVRDQLFAEAAVRYRNGERLYMDTEKLSAAAQAAQAERHAEHPWLERVEAWLAEQDRNPATRSDFYTAREVWVSAMQGTDARFGRREQLDCARVMRDLGWASGFRTHGREKCTRGYWRPKAVRAKPKNVEESAKEKELLGDFI